MTSCATPLNRRAQRFAAAQPAHFLDALGAIADAEAARGNDLRRFVDAAKPLVNSLTDAQRRRLPAFLGITDHAGSAQASGQLWLFEDKESRDGSWPAYRRRTVDVEHSQNW